MHHLYANSGTFQNPAVNWKVSRRSVLLQAIAFLVITVCVVSAQFGGYGILHYDINNIPVRLVRRAAEEE
jgi:hypothetical protein